MAGVTMHLDLAEALAMFARIRAAGRNLRPLMTEIGSELEDSTRQRFRSETDPAGIPWVRISEEWAAEKAERGFASGILKMRGDLLNSVRFEASNDGVSIIASTPYAAVHQFGARIRPKRGRALRVRGRLLSAVNIPARPYIGVSTDDAANILDAAQDFLRRASS